MSAVPGKRLGRKPVVHTLATHLAKARFAALVKALPPAPPGPLGRKELLTRPLGEMLNDIEGDCTAAAKGHFVQLITAANGRQVNVSDRDVEAFYAKTCGYVPGDPSTDQGGNMVVVGRGFCSIGIGGHKAKKMVLVDPRHREHVKHAIHRYGGCDLGISLPLSFQSQVVWDLAPGDGAAAEIGSWGGHDVIAIDYDVHGVWVITWGELQFLTWIAFDAYVDEGIAYHSDEWAHPGGTAPCGISSDELEAELDLVAA